MTVAGRMGHNRLMKACVCIGLMCSIVSAADKKPTVADARDFLYTAESKLLALSVDSGRADWVKNTYITDDTEILAAKANEKLIATTVDLVKQSKQFDGLKLPDDLARKMKLLRLSLTVA